MITVHRVCENARENHLKRFLISATGPKKLDMLQLQMFSDNLCRSYYQGEIAYFMHRLLITFELFLVTNLYFLFI